MRIYEDLRGVQGRVGILQSIVVGCLVLLTAWFWQLQVLRGRYFRSLAENNRIRAVPIPAPRGALFDRHGLILVENRPSFNVVLTLEHSDDLATSVRRLSALLRMREDDIRARLAPQGPKVRSVVVKADATDEDVAVVESRRWEQPEVNIDAVPLRSYPLGPAAAHVLGRVGEVTERQIEAKAFHGVEPGAIVGQGGVEYQYNAVLMGRDGLRRIVVNSRGVEVSEAQREPPVDGPPMRLTLDLRLQEAFEQAFTGHAGAAVALDPNNGEILAMISTPAFDPNEFAKGIDRDEWARLNKDAETPLINRVIQGQYAPGSTFKIPMAIAALEERVITPTTRFHCPGFFNIYGRTFLCRKGGHGTVDLEQAIAQSCNVYFYNVGVRLEIDRISRYGERLGFSAPTGVDLPYEASGLIPSREWKMRTQKVQWFAGETVSVSIGQGAVSVTPLQLARLAAAVANGGRLVTPHLVRSVNGVNTTTPPPQDIGLKPATVAVVREAMIAVVAAGTGRRAQLQGVTVAGKTGSAQVVGHARLERDKKAFSLQPHGWFMCFAPADDPKIAMAVIVEHGTAGGQSAAPLAGQVLSKYFGMPAPFAVPVPEPVPDEPPAPLLARVD